MDEFDDAVGTSGLLFESEMNDECIEEVIENDEYEDLFEPCEPNKKKLKKTYCYPISKSKACEIYQKCGTLLNSVKTPLNVFPQKQIFKKSIQHFINEVKADMKMKVKIRFKKNNLETR